ncbi:MAG: hypothetical protein ACK5L6_05725 [Anaerorhabdus sp.]|uniref:hypothetical protein n=1 Tax=Anaerorhabdus sp. TaxID=1872524 RepID=UPI003A87C8AB
MFEIATDELINEDYPIYKRSPRVIKKTSVKKINVILPPKKEEKKKTTLIKLIIPSLIMLTITVATSLIMKRGIFVLVTALSTLVTMVMSVVTYFDDRKLSNEKEEERQTVYEKYLLRLRKQLFAAYSQQEESLNYHYPNNEDCCTSFKSYL